MRVILSFLIALATLVSPLLHAAEAKRLTVVDYFLQLPRGIFEAPANEMLAILRQPNRGVYDPANGYLMGAGDGAQPTFEAALFLYKDNRSLLAVAQGEYEVEKPRAKRLAFYAPGRDGQMHELRRSIFPVAEKKGVGFELPRKGLTIIVCDDSSRRALARYTWDGEKFVEER